MCFDDDLDLGVPVVVKMKKPAELNLKVGLLVMLKKLVNRLMGNSYLLIHPLGSLQSKEL